MTEEDIPIARVSLTSDEIDAAVNVLESGYLVQGEQVDQFETEFADYVGADHAIAVSNGTAALHVAYLATIPKESEVLVPALSHISTASMVSFAGATPVFCDVDERTFTLDLDSARNQLSDATDAVAPVHLFGNVCNVDAIVEFADEANLTIIWDAAQAHGSTYEGFDVGGFDDVVTYSFYPTKNMTTTEGGMIVTNDNDVAERCRRLRAHWQTEKYYHPSLGLNYRMTDVEAAIGRKQLEKLDGFVSSRRKNGEALTEGLKPIPHVKPPFVDDTVGHSYHQFTVEIDFVELTCDRSTFRDELASDGIETAVHYPRPIHKQPAFDLDVTLPVSERVTEKVLSLPVHPDLNEGDIDRIVSSVQRTVDKFI